MPISECKVGNGVCVITLNSNNVMFPTLEEIVGKVVELRNGNRYIVISNGSIINLSRLETWYSNASRDYDTELKNRGGLGEDFDIMKILEPADGTLENMIKKSRKVIWERTTEPKELTVAEIEKLLGYPIKIVK